MKLAPRRYGPFTVVAKILDVAYWLKLLNMWKIHNVFHTSLLTPYKETDRHGPNFLEPPPDLIDGEEEWEIEKILGHRTYRKKKQYLIRWKGYAPAHDSWTDESGLHAPELLANYKQQLVRRILINLIQTMAEIPHDQSSTAEIPHDQSSTAEIPHDQSSMAETPHDQSALSRRPETIRIRTLRIKDEEAFPTSPHTGSSQKAQKQKALPSSSCKQRTDLLSELNLPSPIYEPPVPRVQARMLRPKFSFLADSSDHMTMYKYSPTRSYDSLIQILTQPLTPLSDLTHYLPIII